MSAYVPTQSDVFAVRDFLLDFVPAEVALIIVDLAEYWPQLSATRESLSGPNSLSGVKRDDEWCYLVSPPLPYYPGTITAAREITFSIECGAACTFDKICSSYTLFNAAIVKSTDLSRKTLYEPLEANPERHVRSGMISDPSRWLVKDIPLGWAVGSREKLVWDDQESLLRNLASGDRVALMIKGVRPGWMNCIYDVSVDIRYSI